MRTRPNEMMSTKWWAAPLGALSILALAACGGGDAEEDAGAAGTEPRQGGTVVIAEGADLAVPNPLVYETVVDGHVLGMIYRPLLNSRWEEGTLRFVTSEESPLALARAYEFFGPDSASLRYRMRSDVRWSDGRPVTAHDAAWTLEAQGKPEVASPRQDNNREIREIVVEDDSTLVVHFTRRYPDMLFHTAISPLPRHQFEGSDLSQLRSHPAVTNPVGTLVTNGPFRLAQWQRGQEVVLDRDPGFQPQAYLDRIVFRIIPEETTRMIELQTGNVDITSVPFQYIQEIRGASNLRIEVQEKRSYEYIAYNPRAHDFFADRDIRRALGLAVNVDEIIAGLQLDEFAEPAGGPYAPIFRLLYDREEQAPLAYDTLEARRILTEKGWTPGPDGVLQKDGERLEFTLITNAENRRRVDITQILERQWRRIGVVAQIQLLEFNTVIERATGKNYEARVGGWNVGLSPDLHALWGDPELPFNEVSYDNPDVQRLIDEALSQPTEEGAARFWREAAARIVADQPYTWLFYYDTPYGVKQRVQGTRVDTLSPYQDPWLWWVTDAAPAQPRQTTSN